MEQTVALRAEWLRQLGDAIDGAQRLAWQLETRHRSSEARELFSRLETARMELDSLRGLARRRHERTDDSDWLGKLGWSSALPDLID